MPELLERTFHGLLTTTGFWAALTADRKQMRLLLVRGTSAHAFDFFDTWWKAVLYKVLS